jgi:prepilin-type N-terminal cleavage/methylation domain-containing protein
MKMAAHPAKPATCRKGFTVAELLVAMTVSSIVLAAVATLAYATGKADTVLDDLLTSQKLVQFDTGRITDAMRYSRRVFITPNGIALWRADDEGVLYGEVYSPNNKINGSELLFLRTVGSDLRLYEFAFGRPPGKTVKELTIPVLNEAAADDPIRLEITIAEIENDTAFNELLNLDPVNLYVTKRTLLKLPDQYNLDVCTDAGLKMAFSNGAFTFPDPLNTGYVNLSYDLTVKRVNQSGQVTSQTTTRYSLPARLLCSADNLIDGTGQLVSDDD